MDLSMKASSAHPTHDVKHEKTRRGGERKEAILAMNDAGIKI